MARLPPPSRGGIKGGGAERLRGLMFLCAVNTARPHPSPPRTGEGEGFKNKIRRKNGKKCSIMGSQKRLIRETAYEGIVLSFPLQGRKTSVGFPGEGRCL